MGEKVFYKCSECGAADSDRQNYGPAPVALICHKCGAGRKMSITDQVASGYGMLQVKPNREEELDE